VISGCLVEKNLAESVCTLQPASPAQLAGEIQYKYVPLKNHSFHFCGSSCRNSEEALSAERVGAAQNSSMLLSLQKREL
jgi:hypothetical protein